MPKKFSKKLIPSFQERTFEVVSRIPKGKVLSYQAVAKLAGKPRAFRAVGNILNKNRSLQVPCHRVIRSNGQVGGYNKGIKKKIALLKKEGIIIYHGQVAF